MERIAEPTQTLSGSPYRFIIRYVAADNIRAKTATRWLTVSVGIREYFCNHFHCAPGRLASFPDTSEKHNRCKRSHP